MSIHPDDLLFFNEVRNAMRRVAKRYELPLRHIEHTIKPESGECYYGTCHTHTGDIYITVRPTFDGIWAEAPLSPAEVWDTAAHELAHLRYANHGDHHAEFTAELLEALTNQQEDHRKKILKKLVKMQAQRDDAAKRAKETGIEEASAEAEAFAHAINRMLIEYELNPTDIDYARAADDDPVVEIRCDLAKYNVESKRARIVWQESLARIVAEAHLCTFLVHPGRNWITFVGTRSHATVAEYVYGTLVRSASVIAHQEYCTYWWHCRDVLGNSKLAAGFKGSWLTAFTARIAERFKTARAEAVREAAPIYGSETTALIRLNGALVKVRRYIDDKFKSKKSSAKSLTTRLRPNAEGIRRGKAAADRMTIGRKGVVGGSDQKKLGA